MLQKELEQEAMYFIAKEKLERMLRKGFITAEEYKKIDDLNRKSYTAKLGKVN